MVPDLQGGGDGAEGQDEEQHEGGPDAGVPQTTLHSQVGAQHCTVHSRGHQCLNLIGIKRRMIDIGKKKLFTFCKMFDNVEFFSHLHLKFAKSAIMTQKYDLFN